MNKQKHQLSLIIGNFEDKLDAIYRCPQPSLTEILEEMCRYPLKHKDHTKVSVLQILYESLKNPNLTKENFNLIYPKLLNPMFYKNLDEWDNEISIHFKNHIFFNSEKKVEIAKFIYEQVVGKNKFLAPAEGFAKLLWKEYNSNKELTLCFESIIQNLFLKMDSITLKKMCQKEDNLKNHLYKYKMYGVKDIEVWMKFCKNILKSRKNTASQKIKESCSEMEEYSINIVNLANEMKKNRSLMIKHIKQNYAKSTSLDSMNKNILIWLIQ